MDFANQLVLIGAGLMTLSIFVGLLSARFGAPLLLVFLLLGMLAGEDGPGGLNFDDFEATYLIGSIALAIILFDGGLRTVLDDVKKVKVPAFLMATLGVLITAGITGVIAKLTLDTGWLEGLLVGSLVASTDAAAVFLLLQQGGIRLPERVRATLEVEAGLNDPMAVFLTITLIDLIVLKGSAIPPDGIWSLAGAFTLQALGGFTAGWLGGIALLAAINRLSIAAGLYPVLAVAGALLIFSVAQEVGASGFLAVYIAGLIVGNRRHRATQVINKFHDGLAWISQIVMFLILGLLVTPSALISTLVPALLISACLIFIARPLATSLAIGFCGYSRPELAFISWVGLRGAVPIYLGTIPVIAQLPGAMTYFEVVYVVVLVSLIVQGWSISTVARRLGIPTPQNPQAPTRIDLDIPLQTDRGVVALVVPPSSFVTKRDLSRISLPEGSEILAILRDGRFIQTLEASRLAPGDYVLVAATSDAIPKLDRLFGSREIGARLLPADTRGEFIFSGDTLTGDVADLYGFSVPKEQRDWRIARFLRRNLFGKPATGRLLYVGSIALIVHEIRKSRIAYVAIELDPPFNISHFIDTCTIWGRAIIARYLS
jgi:cell volume regulation protein A